MESFNEIIKWLNDNQGVLSIAIFLVTLFLGWVSGIFSSLKRKPNLKIGILPGPTFYTHDGEIKNKNNYVHRTTFSVYLTLSNIGFSATCIENVSLAYHWNVGWFCWSAIRYRLGWFWLHDQTVTLNDFQYNIGGHIKVYPSLFQGSIITGRSPSSYLREGESVNGVVYFEQTESWGRAFPLETKRFNSIHTKIKIIVTDAVGNKFKKVFWLPKVDLDSAKKYNPLFGQTLVTLQTQNADGHDN